MRLARMGDPGEEIPIASGPSGTWHDIRSVVADIDGSTLSEHVDRIEAALATGELPEVSPERRWGPPLARVGKVVCIGLNYRDHAAEVGASLPDEPIVFLKTPDTIVGADDTVLIPHRSTSTDWEVELAVVIGAQARYLGSVEDAAPCIAGYAISNDVSEREFQLERGGTWDKGKNCETFNPLGPWITTADQVPDPQALRLRLSVNDQLRQDGSTSDMIFPVDYLVWYVSQFLVLRPGDIINTGTPAGVASGRPDTPYLRHGDLVSASIDGLGTQRSRFEDAP